MYIDFHNLYNITFDTSVLFIKLDIFYNIQHTYEDI